MVTGIIGDENYLRVTRDSEQIRRRILLPSLLEVQLASDATVLRAEVPPAVKNIQHRGELLRMWATYQQTEIPMPFPDEL
jgi:hypothetical protein